jgi:hypothetical protein
MPLLLTAAPCRCRRRLDDDLGGTHSRAAVRMTPGRPDGSPWLVSSPSDGQRIEYWLERLRVRSFFLLSPQMTCFVLSYTYEYSAVSAELLNESLQVGVNSFGDAIVGIPVTYVPCGVPGSRGCLHGLSGPHKENSHVGFLHSRHRRDDSTDVIDVISAISCDVAVLEMGKNERCAGDVADFARAGGDVVEGAPSAGEQGEPSFSQAAQGALDRVASPRIDIEFPPGSGLPHGDQDADARTFIAWIGQGSQAGGGGSVKRGKGVGAGGGDVVHRAGHYLRNPQREPVWGGHRLDVAAVRMRLA